jgi:deoxyribodipyrimidine photo-lyase
VLEHPVLFFPEPPFLSQVAQNRRWAANSAPYRRDGEYVLYWMTSSRRPFYNYALQRAVEWAAELGKPLVIFEPLRAGYRWASPRFHKWVQAGMLDNCEYFGTQNVLYYPYVEPRHGDARGLLESLATRACLVVGDHFPSFFLPRMVNAVAARLPVLLELVDSNGLLPLRAAPRVYERALDFRRFVQKWTGAHGVPLAAREPLLDFFGPVLATLPEMQRWPAHKDFDVESAGGHRMASCVLHRFLDERLQRYSERRSEPSHDFSSGLSPYLHFGHIASDEVFAALAQREGWSEERLPLRATGSRQGAWGMSPNAESFLDEIVVWRELGYNMADRRQDYDQYESLPAWALTTLQEHAGDVRPHVYGLEALANAETADAIWNAAQRQLREHGTIHNYMRMLWGKKILEWSTHPRQALEHLIELNNRYALDGRNPNSYSGIFWCLGRYDRPWFERPIFGKVRYMSSASAPRKFDLKPYLQRWGPRLNASLQTA